MQMWRSFNRILVASIMKEAAMKKVAAPVFHIGTSAVFATARNAMKRSMNFSLAEGVNKPRKKSDSISEKTEVVLLGDVDHQNTHPRGCIKRVVWFLLSVFFVRGGKELQQLLNKHFRTGKTAEGRSFIE
jgi:hypothetical protein